MCTYICQIIYGILLFSQIIFVTWITFSPGWRQYNDPGVIFFNNTGHMVLAAMASSADKLPPIRDKRDIDPNFGLYAPSLYKLREFGSDDFPVVLTSGFVQWHVKSDVLKEYKPNIESFTKYFNETAPAKCYEWICFILMIVVIILYVVAFVFNIMAFFACCCGKSIFKGIPGLNGKCLLLLCIVLTLYGIHYKNDGMHAADTDPAFIWLGYSYFSISIALVKGIILLVIAILIAYCKKCCCGML